MIAYKGFNKDLSCTMGRGIFRYEVGRTYTEDKAQCAHAGFHCVEEPIEVLKWYSGPASRYCIVDAGGDISEDGTNRISCTRMTVIREISLIELYALECRWMQEHPARTYSNIIERDRGLALKNGFVTVRGKQPVAAGGMGALLFLVKEDGTGKHVTEIAVHLVDGKEFKPGIYYRTDGRREDGSGKGRAACIKEDQCYA